MSDRDLNETELNTLFEAARRETAEPGADWLARVADDAARQTAAHRNSGSGRRSFWMQLGDLLGGWQMAGGMAMAGVAGLWIGFAQPGGLDPAGLALGASAEVDVLAGGSFDQTLLIWEQ